MSRSVLITGAGGFVGSHLAEGFCALGNSVTAFDQSFDAVTRSRLARAHLVEAPLTGQTLASLGHFDLVIHGAAITTAPADIGMSDVAHTKANVDLLLDCLDFAVTSRASHFVFISSSGVFDFADATDVLLESTIATGKSPYSVAKRIGEIATDAANSDHLTAIAIRLGPIYGPAEALRDTRINLSPVRRWLDQALRGETIEIISPASVRDWTFAPDLAPALDRVLSAVPPVRGVVHFTSGAAISDIDLANAIIALTTKGQLMVKPDHTPPRLPMRSERLDLAQLYPWTPLADGLCQTLAEEARP